MVSIIITLYF